jgi:hypothetical protein
MKVGTFLCLLVLWRFIVTILTHAHLSEWPCAKEKRIFGFQKLVLFAK